MSEMLSLYYVFTPLSYKRCEFALAYRLLFNFCQILCKVRINICNFVVRNEKNIDETRIFNVYSDAGNDVAHLRMSYSSLLQLRIIDMFPRDSDVTYRFNRERNSLIY